MNAENFRKLLEEKQWEQLKENTVPMDIEKIAKSIISIKALAKFKVSFTQFKLWYRKKPFSMLQS